MPYEMNNGKESKIKLASVFSEVMHFGTKFEAENCLRLVSRLNLELELYDWILRLCWCLRHKKPA